MRWALAVVLGMSLACSFVLRLPCLAHGWPGDTPATMYCYSDILSLYGVRGAAADLIPYVEVRNEYPVLTGVVMAVAAAVSEGPSGFLVANALILAAAAAATALALWDVVGLRALYVVAAPSLILYGLLNWDLLAVGLATVGTLLFLRRRELASGVALGLGVAAKGYPVLLIAAFALDRYRCADPKGLRRLLLGAAGAWALANLPVAVLAFERWQEFFRFNAARGPTVASLWAVGCQLVAGRASCLAPSTLNLLSLAAFLLAGGLVVRRTIRERPAGQTWLLALPLLIVFVLTNKVFSPQYALWLLPWFALVCPNPWLFVAFEVSNLAVYATEFPTVAHPVQEVGLALMLAALGRAATLLVWLAWWLRRRSLPLWIPEGASADA